MKIIEVSQSGVYLSISHGFMVINIKNEEIAREPIDSIDCLLIHGFGISYSHNLLTKFCEENIPVILCGKNFMPIGSVNSFYVNYERKARLEEQLKISLPLKKRLWQKIIKEKIKNQQITLKNAEKDSDDFSYLISKVRSGDSKNTEAAAARKYWKRLFGEDFKRDHLLTGINNFLNFGYAILRSTVSRYIVASGLEPSLGLHHKNNLNTFCLADDMMEPFRPFIDNEVRKMKKDKGLLPEHKKRLIALLDIRYHMNNQNLTLQNCIKETIFSLLDSFRDKKNLLKFPQYK